MTALDHILGKYLQRQICWLSKNSLYSSPNLLPCFKLCNKMDAMINTSLNSLFILRYLDTLGGPCSIFHFIFGNDSKNFTLTLLLASEGTISVPLISKTLFLRTYIIIHATARNVKVMSVI